LTNLQTEDYNPNVPSATAIMLADSVRPVNPVAHG